MVLTRRECEICHPLHSQLIPNLGQIIALVELDFICDDSCTKPFIRRVLEVPAGLRLLDVFAYNSVLIAGRRFHHLPDLQILDSVAIGVLGRTLPSN